MVSSPVKTGKATVPWFETPTGSYSLDDPVFISGNDFAE